MALLSERRVGYDRLVGEHASAATHRSLPGATTVPSTAAEPSMRIALERTQREKDSLRV